MNSNSAFTPDWLSPPGDTIADILEERGWDKRALSRRLGYRPERVNQLINGKARITEETALKLENVLGSSAKFWMSREAHYRAALATDEEAEKYRQWADQMPVKDLMKIGVIPKRRVTEKSKPAIVKDLLQFFSVASPEEWQQKYGQLQAAFRRGRKNQNNTGAITAWLRLGELQAETIKTRKYSKRRFKNVLQEIRKLTVKDWPYVQAHIHHLCASAGVLLVFVPAIPGAGVSGVARWLNGRPMIQLSFYGKTNDRFWFNFFHEAGHIVLHGDQIFLDDFQKTDKHSKEEAEADTFASNRLIPEKYQEALKKIRSGTEITNFAKQIGIHPGIVVGRLQHDGYIEHSWHNDLKERISMVEDPKNQMKSDDD